MPRRIVSKLASIGLMALGSACSSQPLDTPDGNAGSLRAAIELGASTHDVTAVRFDVVAAEGSCDDAPLSTHTAALEAELAPAALNGAEAEQHHFASSLFTLLPGAYRVCATPLTSESAPSAVCGAASDLAQVSAEQSSQLTLVSQCQADASGGLDVAVTLNNPPQIQAVTVTDSTYITVCESAELVVAASDPDADALEYAWSVVSGPAPGSLRSNGAAATFSGPAGDYVLSVTATDTHAAHASFLVTIHVSDATCEVSPAVFDIINAKCSPCHTTGASGGLKLAPADVAYASLVNHAVGAAACASHVRVVPGDPEASYIIAKLRGAAGICGLPMPRNRPALPEEEIQTIENWIESLPH